MAAGAQSPDSPTKEQWAELSQEVKGLLLEEIGSESWYLLIVSRLSIAFACYYPHPYEGVDWIGGSLSHRRGTKRLIATIVHVS